MAKVIVIVADGFEEIEAVSVIDILRRADVEVSVTGIKDGYATGAQNIVIRPDTTLEDIDEDDYDMVVLPGGTVGARNINKSREADLLIRKFAEEEKYIAAICAAPYVLAEKGILKGCMATSYPGFREKVEKDSEYVEAVVVVDENIITSRGPATAAEFGFTLVELLVSEEKAEELREAMLFNYMNED